MYFLFIECNSFVTALYRKYTLGQEGIQETQLFYKGYKVFQDFSEIFLTCCRGYSFLSMADLLSGPTGRKGLPVHGSILRIEQLLTKKKIFLKE